ncbi:hypothetical protein IPM44_02090 [bacterium]|nr:MAG: hypothetical protein IPM44_02090 [bacterium]
MRKKKHSINRGKKGFTLLITLVMGGSFLVIGLAIYRSSLINYSNVRRDYNSLNALAVAEAGADSAIASLNANTSYSGTTATCPLSDNPTGGTELYNDAIKGRAVYDSCIQAGSIPNEKILWAKGRIYRPQSSTTPTATRTVKITLIASTLPATNYSVQTGPGGLIMTNSARISNGAVYVGGTLSMSNTAQIGSVATPVATQVAHYTCPVPATSAYPSLCSTGQPITLTNQAHIYGNVSANNQINGNGMTNGGLVASSGVPAPTLPDYDRASHKAAATNNLTGSQASCWGNQQITWPANVKITGTVNLSNNCQVTMSGPVWITGNLNISNRGILRIASGVTTTPAIMIDGSGGLNLANQGTVAANSAGIGPKIITFWANASCSPDCTSVTGTQLASSQNQATINISNQGLGAPAELYARWSKIQVSNGGTVGRLLGQTIQFSNTGSVSFGLGVGSTPGETVWSVQFYDRQ